MGRWLLALVFAVSVAAPAHAQLARQLPANGKLAALAGGQPLPTVLIDGKPRRLTPGAVIFDTNNRTIVHNALPASATVLYVQDQTGDVTRIYILRPEEIEQVKRRPAAKG